MATFGREVGSKSCHTLPRSTITTALWSTCQKLEWCNTLGHKNWIPHLPWKASARRALPGPPTKDFAWVFDDENTKYCRSKYVMWLCDWCFWKYIWLLIFVCVYRKLPAISKRSSSNLETGPVSKMYLEESDTTSWPPPLRLRETQSWAAWIARGLAEAAKKKNMNPPKKWWIGTCRAYTPVI